MAKTQIETERELDRCYQLLYEAEDRIMQQRSLLEHLRKTGRGIRQAEAILGDFERIFGTMLIHTRIVEREVLFGI